MCIVENGAQNSASGSGYIAPVPVLPPTGTVTLSSSPSGISGTATLSAGLDPSDGAVAGIGVINLASSIAAGNYNVTFNYSGDSNYNGGTAGPATITVVGVTGLTASTTTASIIGSHFTQFQHHRHWQRHRYRDQGTHRRHHHLLVGQ